MKKGVTINFTLTNRWLYTLIALILILIVSVGVYAFGTSDPETFGHSAGELEVNIDGATKTLQTAIDAGDLSGSWLTGAGGKIYYNGGNVGIGTDTPLNPLGIRGTGELEEFISFEDSAGTTKWRIHRFDPPDSEFFPIFPGLNFVEAGVSGPGLFIQEISGNVGIGMIPAPGAKLDIAGFVQATRFCLGGFCIDEWPSGGGAHHDHWSGVTKTTTGSCIKDMTITNGLITSMTFWC